MPCTRRVFAFLYGSCPIRSIVILTESFCLISASFYVIVYDFSLLLSVCIIFKPHIKSLCMILASHEVILYDFSLTLSHCVWFQPIQPLPEMF